MPYVGMAAGEEGMEVEEWLEEDREWFLGRCSASWLR